jgi:hypothetical protein
MDVGRTFPSLRRLVLVAPDDAGHVAVRIPLDFTRLPA